VALGLGPAFGDLTFEFGSARARAREARADTRGEHVVYSDAVSGEPLSFFAPFPGWMSDFGLPMGA
jgi:hypothetical protein